MKQHRSALTATLRLLALVASLSVLPAQADDYEDVTQLLRSNQFASALTLVDRHLASKPADPQMRFLKGVILRNLGKQAEAIAIFTKLTEDYPELPEPYNNLAVLYAGQGQFDKARMALEVAIRTNPSYATAHENIGDIYARLASQAYNKALQLDSGNAAVPPKLALIREIFKPNLGAARPAASAAVTTATAAPTSKPEPVAVAAVVSKAVGTGCQPDAAGCCSQTGSRCGRQRRHPGSTGCGRGLGAGLVRQKHGILFGCLQSAICTARRPDTRRLGKRPSLAHHRQVEHQCRYCRSEAGHQWRQGSRQISSVIQSRCA